MKTNLTIEQFKGDEFIELIEVVVWHTNGYSLNNGNYYSPDDYEPDTVDSIEMDGYDITDQLIDMGFSTYDILQNCSGVSSSSMRTEIDITELSAQQLKNSYS